MWYMSAGDPAADGRQLGARDRLLAAAVDHATEHGLSHLSMRQLAEALGTSHRMLHYHFGSKEGLLTAVVEAFEEQERAYVAELARQARADTPASLLRSLWAQLADRAMWPRERLFFEVYGQALQGHTHSDRFLERLIAPWLEPATDIAVRAGTPPTEARAQARLNLAVTRGLLLDLLATHDRAGADEAMAQFVALLDRR